MKPYLKVFRPFYDEIIYAYLMENSLKTNNKKTTNTKTLEKDFQRRYFISLTENILAEKYVFISNRYIFRKYVLITVLRLILK